MNTLYIKGSWNKVAGKLKQIYANLTDDYLLFMEGKEEEYIGAHLKYLGKIKDDIHTLLKTTKRAFLYKRLPMSIYLKE